MQIKKKGTPVPLKDCPFGLFEHDGEIFLNSRVTKYSTTKGADGCNRHYAANVRTGCTGGFREDAMVQPLEIISVEDSDE